MKKIEVVFSGWGESWTLGTLASNGTDTVFEYSPQALQQGVELSPVHLKLRTEAFSGFLEHQAFLPGLIADALPDGWGLLLMDKLFLKAGRDLTKVTSLDRLGFIGSRAMGALAFRPADTLVPADETADDELSLLELAKASADVIEDRETPALKLLAFVGGSPHGARPKAVVQYDESTGTVSTRGDAAGAAWLVKFPAQHEHKEVCAVEYAYSVLARESGCDVPTTRYFDVAKNMSAFGIERFDREAGMRVPVHSFAGALNANFRLPSLDYQTVLRATRVFTRDEAEVEKAFSRCVLNVILNNRDDHAKNFSFRMNRHMQWKLSPVFDLTFNTGPRGEHQSAVMGESRKPGRADLLKLAADSGVRQAAAIDAIDKLCEDASRIATFLAAFEIRKSTRKTIADAVSLNVKRCSSGLSLPVRTR
jgi:serine/threonine-protein kinase HipA